MELNADTDLRTYRISFDDGIVSGSCNPGWLVEWPTDSGTWMPIDDPFGPFPRLDVDADTQPEGVAAAIKSAKPVRGVTLVGDGWQQEL